MFSLYRFFFLKKDLLFLNCLHVYYDRKPTKCTYHDITISYGHNVQKFHEADAFVIECKGNNRETYIIVLINCKRQLDNVGFLLYFEGWGWGWYPLKFRNIMMYFTFFFVCIPVIFIFIFFCLWIKNGKNVSMFYFYRVVWLFRNSKHVSNIHVYVQSIITIEMLESDIWIQIWKQFLPISTNHLG